MIPAPARVAIALAGLAWTLLHLRAWPLDTFAWTCAHGTVLAAAGLALQSRLLVSWQAVALLVPQLLWVSEALARLVTGARGGGTSYVFDGSLPPWVRLLSAAHVVVPVLLVWGVRRLGYDRRALPLQLVAAVALALLTRPLGPVNLWCVPWARAHAVAAVLLLPLLLHVPPHVVLTRVFEDGPAVRSRS